jgi:hypothetical protein
MATVLIEREVEPMPEVHPGKWQTRPATLTCHKCGGTIPSGSYYLFFPWFPGRKHWQVCQNCARG